MPLVWGFIAVLLPLAIRAVAGEDTAAVACRERLREHDIVYVRRRCIMARSIGPNQYKIQSLYLTSFGLYLIRYTIERLVVIFHDFCTRGDVFHLPSDNQAAMAPTCFPYTFMVPRIIPSTVMVSLGKSLIASSILYADNDYPPFFMYQIADTMGSRMTQHVL